MMLAAGPGCEIVLKVKGNQAKEALEALTELIKNRFGEE
jgi:phosphocarrier protein